MVKAILDTDETVQWVYNSVLKDTICEREIGFVVSDVVTSDNNVMELRLFDHVEKIYIDVVNDSLRKANDGTWYIQNGKLDTKFSGKVTISGKTYTIKNGKVM